MYEYGPHNKDTINYIICSNMTYNYNNMSRCIDRYVQKSSQTDAVVWNTLFGRCISCLAPTVLFFFWLSEQKRGFLSLPAGTWRTLSYSFFLVNHEIMWHLPKRYFSFGLGLGTNLYFMKILLKYHLSPTKNTCCCCCCRLILSYQEPIQTSRPRYRA